MWPQVLDLNVGEPGAVNTPDGSRKIIVRGIEHAFARSGLYSAAFTATGPGGEPLMTKLPVAVEPACIRNRTGENP